MDGSRDSSIVLLGVNMGVWLKRNAFNVGLLLVIAIIALAFVLRPGAGAPRASADSGYQAEYGGSSTVYAGIAANTDCASLQETFDGAADINDAAEPGTTTHRSSLGYMLAAEERMESLGC